MQIRQTTGNPKEGFVVDKYDAIRRLPFPALAGALGIDIKEFRRSGTDWVGPCPIHGSKNNKNCFRYNDDGRFHCFSQEEKGRGAIDFTIQLKKIGFQAAVELLTAISPSSAPIAPENGNSGVSQPSGKPIDLTKYRKYARPCEWLDNRVDKAMQERYGVFYYENNSRKSAFNRRVMIPVKGLDNQLFGYLGRWIGTPDQQYPKYLFPRGLEKSRYLFGAAELGTFGSLPLRRVFLVESPFCVMKFASIGFPAVAAYGWSVSEEQISILAQVARGIVYLPDRNKHQEAGNSLGRIAERLWLRCPELPAGVDDPEQMTREQILAL